MCTAELAILECTRREVKKALLLLPGKAFNYFTGRGPSSSPFGGLITY